MISKMLQIPSRLGVIGKPSDWLIASNIDRQIALHDYGVEFVDIPFDEFAKEIDQAHYPCDEKVDNIREKAAKSQYLEGALNIYGALSRLISKYHLDGFSIRCFDLLGTYKNTACLALALLNDYHLSAGCEGDLPILLAMHLVRRWLNAPAFQANPSAIFPAEHTIYFAHCTIPFSMCKNCTFLTHFESDLGIGIRGELPLSPVTIFRLSSDLKKVFVEEGVIIQNLKRDDMCRTQIAIKVKGDLGKLLISPLGNHHLIVLGHHKKKLLHSVKTINPAIIVV